MTKYVLKCCAFIISIFANPKGIPVIYHAAKLGFVSKRNKKEDGNGYGVRAHDFKI